MSILCGRRKKTDESWWFDLAKYLCERFGKAKTFKKMAFQFDQIWQNFKNIWQLFEGLISIWQTFEPTL